MEYKDFDNKTLPDHTKVDSKVYVYVPSYIYVLDLNNDLAEILNIVKFQNDLDSQAREIVIQNEIDL